MAKTKKQLRKKIKTQRRTIKDQKQVIRDLVQGTRVERTTTWDPPAPAVTAVPDASAANQ